MYVVSKTFTDGNIQRNVGELVVGTGYRMLDKLVSLRYLRPVKLKKSEETAFKCELCETERFFIDEKTLENHYLIYHADQIEVVDDGDDKSENTDDGGEAVKDEVVEEDKVNNETDNTI